MGNFDQVLSWLGSDYQEASACVHCVKVKFVGQMGTFGQLYLAHQLIRAMMTRQRTAMYNVWIYEPTVMIEVLSWLVPADEEASTLCKLKFARQMGTYG